MWIYKDKRSFPPAIRTCYAENSEYTRGWNAALASLRDTAKPDQARGGNLLAKPEQPSHA